MIWMEFAGLELWIVYFLVDTANGLVLIDVV